MKQFWLHEAIDCKLEELADHPLQPVEIAVLDSGIDSTHPDLKGFIIDAYSVQKGADKWETIGRPAFTNNDVFGHGTAVASIIAKIAPNARIIDIRVLDSNNRGCCEALVEGLRFAVESKAPVINLSLAVKSNLVSKLLDLTEKAYYQGQILVAAKRNIPLGDYGLPAVLSSVISVDNEDFPSPFHFLYRSHHVIEYIARGESITVAAPGGRYTTQSGTSFATPVVSGLCALLFGAYPDIKQFEMKTILKALSMNQQAG
jgi:subtilisin